MTPLGAGSCGVVSPLETDARESVPGLVSVSCNLCGSGESTLVAVQAGYRMVECRSCGLAYVNPRPPLASLRQHYETYLPPGTRNADDWEVMMAGVFDDAARRIERLVSFPTDSGRRGRLLDVGCARGSFLLRMAGRGWEVEGIDLSAASVAKARERGLAVCETTLEDAGFEEHSFDVVTAFYVLEHVVDPKGLVREVARILRPGGLAVFRIPHTTPIVRLLGLLGIRNNLYDMPSHLFDFSPKVLASLLERAGFEIIEMTPQRPTARPRLADRIVTYAAFGAARMGHSLSGGCWHFPGVSTTTFARKKN